MLSYVLPDNPTTGEWVFETLTEIPYDSRCKFDIQIEVSKNFVKSKQVKINNKKMSGKIRETKASQKVFWI